MKTDKDTTQPTGNPPEVAAEATGSPPFFITLPDYAESETMHFSGESDAIHEFVFHGEPAGEEEGREWRKRLNEALDMAYIEGLRVGKRDALR